MNEPNLWLCVLLVAGGMLGHFVKKLYDLEQAGTILSPLTYARERPYSVAMAVIGGYLLAAFWYFVGQLNEVAALLTGIGCSSAFDTLRARAAGKMKTLEDGAQAPRGDP